MSKIYEKAKMYTEKYKDKLCPCRKCGNTNIVIMFDRSIFDKKYTWSVNCTTLHCDFSTGETVKEAVEKWNSKNK